MEALESAVREELEKVQDQYDDFIKGIFNLVKSFGSENPNILPELLAYLEQHDDLTASNVCEYMCYLIGLPYGENGKWYRWDTEITEEEAQRIVDEKYSG